jgi:hypothetical protein
MKPEHYSNSSQVTSSFQNQNTIMYGPTEIQAMLKTINSRVWVTYLIQFGQLYIPFKKLQVLCSCEDMAQPFGTDFIIQEESDGIQM